MTTPGSKSTPVTWLGVVNALTSDLVAFVGDVDDSYTLIDAAELAVMRGRGREQAVWRGCPIVWHPSRGALGYGTASAAAEYQACDPEEVRDLKATLARVTALADKWHTQVFATTPLGMAPPFGPVVAERELRAALNSTTETTT